MNQLSLPFKLDSKMLLDDFIGIKNNQIIEFFNKLLTNNDHAVVYIYGAKSSGKTHLLQGFTFAALAKKLDAVYIDLTQDIPSDIFENLNTVDCLCIDNIHILNEEQQYSLFDIYNQAAQRSLKLIVSSNSMPNDLNLLTDLKTRLCLATLFSLEGLDDESNKLIIDNKVIDRNLNIDSKIYDYLFKYYSRDLQVVLDAIELLDEASLQKKSNITIPLVKQVLSI